MIFGLAELDFRALRRFTCGIGILRLKDDIRYWMYFPDSLGAQLGRTGMWALRVRYIKEQRALDLDWDWRIVVVISSAGELAFDERLVGGPCSIELIEGRACAWRQT